MSTRPVPRPDPDSAPFWAGCARGELLGQRCGSCAAWRWPPREHCPHCHRADPVWEPLGGTGRIVGRVVVHRPLDPAFADAGPLTVLHVALDGTDGAVVLTSTLAPGAGVGVGDRVTVRFDRLPDGTVLPSFTPVADPTAAPAHEEEHRRALA